MLVGKYLCVIICTFVVVVPMDFAMCWSVHFELDSSNLNDNNKIQSIKCLLYNFNPMKIFSI